MDERFAERLAQHRVLGALLEHLRVTRGGYTLADHWKQGEFHHDVVVILPTAEIVVVATNCNGGVKEVLLFDRMPQRYALWHWRCPDIADFSGELPPIRQRAITEHWFNPCELLAEDARSELLPEFRKRQLGGGWEFCGAIDTPLKKR